MRVTCLACVSFASNHAMTAPQAQNDSEKDARQRAGVLRRANATFKSLQFNIDDYLEPFVPRDRVGRLPKPIHHFLGHRDEAQQPVGNIAIATWSLLGGFIGTVILASFFKSDFIKNHGGPVIVGSYVCHVQLVSDGLRSRLTIPHRVLPPFLNTMPLNRPFRNQETRYSASFSRR